MGIQTHFSCSENYKYTFVSLQWSSPEDKDQILLLCFFGLVSGIIQGVAAIIWGQHLHKVLVRVLDGGSQVTLQDLFAIIQNNILEVLAHAEHNGLLPLPLLVLICLSLAHLHVIEDCDNFICDFHTGGLWKE